VSHPGRQDERRSGGAGPHWYLTRYQGLFAPPGEEPQVIVKIQSNLQRTLPERCGPELLWLRRGMRATLAQASLPGNRSASACRRAVARRAHVCRSSPEFWLWGLCSGICPGTRISQYPGLRDGR
jgi:hypothetical protein